MLGPSFAGAPSTAVARSSCCPLQLFCKRQHEVALMRRQPGAALQEKTKAGSAGNHDQIWQAQAKTYSNMSRIEART
eukprot:6850601-Karenia_brevis.AAC.1